MKLHPIFWQCILACLLVLGIFACKEQGTLADYKVFKYNQENHITSLDPVFAKSQNNIWATHHIFNTLLALDDSLNIVPDLAHRYLISDDGKTYTFYLRDKVLFHPHPALEGKGRRVTAQDFVYSFQRLIDPELNSPGSWLFTDKVAGKEAFKAPNDSTFVIQLTKPFNPLLGILTMQYCSVVPKEVVQDKATDFGKTPIGTGPFMFKRWEPNQALYLVRNKEYFRPIRSNLDGIKTTFIPDKKIAFLELLNGDLDFVSGLESSFISELLTKDGDLQDSKKADLAFTKAPYLNMEYLGINLENQPAGSPLRNKYIRQALNWGFDRSLMLKSLRNGVGQPANAGFIPAGLPSHDPNEVTGYNYDPARAQELIRKAGYASAAAVPPFTLYTNKDYLDLTSFIVNQWEDLGLRVDIEVLESAILREGMRSGKIPFFRASWIADYPDGESFLCMFYSRYPAPPNYTFYENSTFDELYDKAIAEPELAEKYQLYQEMDRILVEEAPVIFLFYDQTALFSGRRVEGISSNAVNLLKVENLRVE